MNNFQVGHRSICAGAIVCQLTHAITPFLDAPFYSPASPGPLVAQETFRPPSGASGGRKCELFARPSGQASPAR
eukprot:3778447-Alexandrium_andersonii.AAC.1